MAIRSTLNDVTARQLWSIGLVGPLAAYLVVGLVVGLATVGRQRDTCAPTATNVPRAWLRRGRWPDDGGLPAWLALGVGLGWVLVLANASLGMAIGHRLHLRRHRRRRRQLRHRGRHRRGRRSLHRRLRSNTVDHVALAGILAGIACALPLRGLRHRPVLAILLPFGWNVLALWTVAY